MSEQVIGQILEINSRTQEAIIDSPNGQETVYFEEFNYTPIDVGDSIIITKTELDDDDYSVSIDYYDSGKNRLKKLVIITLAVIIPIIIIIIGVTPVRQIILSPISREISSIITPTIDSKTSSIKIEKMSYGLITTKNPNDDSVPAENQQAVNIKLSVKNKSKTSKSIYQLMSQTTILVQQNVPVTLGINEKAIPKFKKEFTIKPNETKTMTIPLVLHNDKPIELYNTYNNKLVKVFSIRNKQFINNLYPNQNIITITNTPKGVSSFEKQISIIQE